jgi:hypothetical protein
MRLIYLIFGILLGFYFADVYAQDTTINYRGQPVPSAIAPSMSAFSQDVCGIPVSGAISSTVIGVSGGSVYTDTNCERIKLAKTLNDLGLKVAAVGILCEDERVWRAMEMSGSPCPIGGSIGDSARKAWAEREPKRFEKLYGKVPTFGEPATTAGETK